MTLWCSAKAPRGMLEIVLDILRQNKLYAKLPTGEFNKPELQFLGHIVGKHGIGMDPAKTAAISDWPVPEDVHQLQSFLGWAIYCRRFVQVFPMVISPVTNLTMGNTSWVWSE